MTALEPSTSAMPNGPWLVVLGMHRSGTSLVAGLLGALGFQVPRFDDRIHDQPWSNPEHWESASMVRFNDELLDQLGGSWDAPPVLNPGWQNEPRLREVGDPG
ncbi:MAG: hypothetical protein ACLQPH_08190, partial [Acidimicrobiales bacterium]